MGRALAICSGKGGTGKTSCAAALAAALCARRRRVLVIDCDVGLRNLDLILGVSDQALFDFSDVLHGRVELSDAALEHPQLPGLFVITAPLMLRASDIDPGEMTRLIRAACADFDYVIADAPAGIGVGFQLALCGADQAIVVANPDAASLRDGQRAAFEADALGAASTRLLVNRVQKRLLRLGRSNIDSIIDTIGVQLIGLVAEDKNVILAGNAGIPLQLYKETGKGGAAAQFSRIAARLDGERRPLGRI